MASEKGKSLSKNLLYTPLKAYLQNDAATSASAAVDDAEQHPSQYMKNLKSNVPKSIHESSLATFLHSVSQDYHCNQATAHDARNNGSRPLSLDEVENRVRQRAVTLLGGGINASLPTSSKRHSNKTKRKKRPRKSWSEVEKTFQQSKRCKPEEMLDEVSFLRHLNQKWNAYMCRMLAIDNKMGDDDNSNASMSMLEDQIAEQARSISRLEKVGAHVRVESCMNHKAWEGRFGVIVSETLKTYHVVGMKLTKKAKRENLKETNSSDAAPDLVASIETFVVPKQGTCLVMLLPLPLFDLSETNNERKDSADDDDTLSSSSSTLIPLADKTINLTLRQPA